MRAGWKLLAAAAIAASGWAGADGPHFATGIRIGETTAHSAIVWTRLTRDAEHVPFGGPMPDVRYKDKSGEWIDEVKDRDPRMTPVVSFPGIDASGPTEAVQQLEGAAPGTEGEVRVRYRVEGAAEWTDTEWAAVDPARDFTKQFPLEGLESGATYELTVESRTPEGNPGDTVEGGFHTAPEADAETPVNFVVTTCYAYPDRDAPDGFKIYDQILKLNPDFFVHTGDILYYDKLAKSIDLARWHWQRMYSMPTNVRFHRQVGSYFMKDDHDTWVNDCWPGMESTFMGNFTFEQGQAVFLEQVPMGDSTYRTVRWGKDLQIWMVEGRDFRSPNTMKDGPEKSIWGAEQMAWFKRTVAESEATFRVLISPTPVVGPDRPTKNDNHANRGFAHEGREIREFMATQPNLFSICGDRHWQYVSHAADTGTLEFACGPASNEHAGGWKPEDRRPEHTYMNVTGGFLALDVARDDEGPRLRARHYSVDGEVLHEEVLRPE
ncbi:MAG: alkaline phosphatase [Candidatus Hydrogenedens sp.]|nr:alkaline phosphatase [Candidatus Hydrogenedens sp.]